MGLNDASAQYVGTGSNSNTEYVEGYYKDNGTYVEGYYRTESNNYNLDNFNAEGNYNPYYGEYGDVEYESPYNSYYSREYDTDLNSFDYNKNSSESDWGF